MASEMGRLPLPVVPVLLALFSGSTGGGCTKLKLLKECESDCDCEPYGLVCVVAVKKCHAPFDMSVEMDMSGGMTDAGTDAGVDAMVDLRPMCIAATECSDPAKPICGADGGTCRICRIIDDDAQCGAHSQGIKCCQISGTNAGRCVECRSSMQATDCAAATPICNTSGACRKCLAHAE